MFTGYSNDPENLGEIFEVKFLLSQEFHQNLDDSRVWNTQERWRSGWFSQIFEVESQYIVCQWKRMYLFYLLFAGDYEGNPENKTCVTQLIIKKLGLTEQKYWDAE